MGVYIGIVVIEIMTVRASAYQLITIFSEDDLTAVNHSHESFLIITALIMDRELRIVICGVFILFIREEDIVLLT